LDSSSLQGRWTRASLWAAVFGIALYLALDALAQLLPPHYSPISQAESDLAVGPYGYIMAINFLNRGALSFLFLWGLSRSASPRPGQRLGYSLVGLWAAGSMILAAFPTDVGGSPTIHGEIHLVVALLAFVGGAIGELVLSTALRSHPKLWKTAKFTTALSVLALILLAALFFGPAIAPKAAGEVGGLVERIFIGLVLTWMLVSSLTLLRGSNALSSQASKPAGVRAHPLRWGRKRL